MKALLAITTIFILQASFSQELDIFQNDSIYSKNKITTRTMYTVNGSSLQKELVTNHNTAGKKIKQFWFWNGDKNFHNVETFYYNSSEMLSSITDSFTDGNIEITSFFYDGNNALQKRVTLNNKDTTDFRTYPNSNTTIQRWYMDGSAYRFDTTIYEIENAKLEYIGSQKAEPPGDNYTWHYKYKNEFDEKGNLIKVFLNVDPPFKSFTKYEYDKRGLLIKKQEIILIRKKQQLQTEYYFTYE